MSRADLVLRVAARFSRRADQAPGKRKNVKDLTKPINNPKGIARETVRDQAYTDVSGDAIKPERKDIRPEDVFTPKPINMNVVNYVREGWPGKADEYKDMEKAISKQIPKDKGYATVSGLSQYLLRTEGGGGTKPVGKK